MSDITDAVVIHDDEGSLPFPPVSWGDVKRWAAEVSHNALVEIYSVNNEAVTGSDMELVGAAFKKLVLADQDATGADEATDTIDVTASEIQDGDGPFRFVLVDDMNPETTEEMPGGLEEGVDYWIAVDGGGDHFVYASLEDLLADPDHESPIDITSAGTAFTIEYTEDTKRLTWLTRQTLGPNESGDVVFQAGGGYSTHFQHVPQTKYYALVGTVDNNITAEVVLIDPVGV